MNELPMLPPHLYWSRNPNGNSYDIVDVYGDLHDSLVPFDELDACANSHWAQMQITKAQWQRMLRNDRAIQLIEKHGRGGKRKMGLLLDLHEGQWNASALSYPPGTDTEDNFNVLDDTVAGVIIQIYGEDDAK